MQIVIWDASLEFGIASIDAEHRYLVELTNAMHEGIVAGNAKTLLGEVLGKLLAYTREHFANEERLFIMHGYDGEEHVRQHRQLTLQVLDFKRRFDEGELSVSVHLVYFLRDWLLNHIKRVDSQYVAFLKSKGVH